MCVYVCIYICTFLVLLLRGDASDVCKRPAIDEQIYRGSLFVDRRFEYTDSLDKTGIERNEARLYIPRVEKSIFFLSSFFLIHVLSVNVSRRGGRGGTKAKKKKKKI